MSNCSQRYTYIIVGAGSAGCLLANRLSSQPENRVLLIEAGSWSNSFWLKLPVGYYKTMNDPSVSRHFATEPSKGSGGRAINWPRGRVIGGSSSINGLIFIRGQHKNFNDWAELGNDGWSYRDVLPYFRKLENFSGGNSQFHGQHGEFQVSKLRNHHPDCEAWLSAAQQYGLTLNQDFNAETTEGVGEYHLSIGSRWRTSSASAFLKPVESRKNLKIITNTLVTRIIFENKKAVGVEIISGGHRQIIHADAEVILSAGAIQSPQILQLSGIGPAKLLKKYGVKVISDRPGVGQNLQDHYQMRTIVKMRSKTSLNNQIRNPISLIRMGLDWAFRGRGALTVGAGQVGGAMRTRFAPTNAPDLQLFVMPLSVDKPGEPLHHYSGFTSAIWQCHPKSRGSIEINSPDPTANPKISPNYLDDSLDQKTMVEGIKILRKIYRQPQFCDLWDTEIVPGDYVKKDSEILQAIRQGGGTVYHPVGTCKMGIDSAAVVAPDLRVHGVTGLRVADASIMPLITSANTNAPTLMIAEKAADIILESVR